MGNWAARDSADPAQNSWKVMRQSRPGAILRTYALLAIVYSVGSQ